MARINKTATLQMAEFTRRGNFVIEDPAVVKAAKQAHQDLAQAARSGGALANEIRASWGRSA